MAPKIPQNKFAVNFSDNLVPPHPHRRMHILLSVLAFLVVAGSITFYQINRSNKASDTADIDISKEQKLIEVSQTLKIQPQTEEFKTKLQQMSDSLNK